MNHPGIAGGGFFIPFRRFPVVGGKQNRGNRGSLPTEKQGF